MGAAFGAEDFTNDMAIERTTNDSEVEVARHLLCIAARAADVPALDTPYFAFRDDDALAENAQASRRMGFKGKFAIHPAQIQTINATFAPSEAEIEHARRIVAAFEQAELALYKTARLSSRLRPLLQPRPCPYRSQLRQEDPWESHQNHRIQWLLRGHGRSARGPPGPRSSPAPR